MENPPLRIFCFFWRLFSQNIFLDIRKQSDSTGLSKNTEIRVKNKNKNKCRNFYKFLSQWNRLDLNSVTLVLKLKRLSLRSWHVIKFYNIYYLDRDIFVWWFSLKNWSQNGLIMDEIPIPAVDFYLINTDPLRGHISKYF